MNLINVDEALSDSFSCIEESINCYDAGKILDAANAAEQALHNLEHQIVSIRNYLSTLCIDSTKFLQYCDEKSAETYGITIQSKKHFRFTSYKISLPFLLPNRRTSTAQFKQSICSSLKNEIEKFCRKNRVKPIEKAVVVFVLYYCKSDIKLHMHDNDNTEISAILNCLSGNFIVDDSGLMCDLIILSRLTNTNKSYSEVLVSPLKFGNKMLNFK